MINKIFSQQKDDFHNIYNIFGLKFKFKDKKNIIKKCGRNNHVYILFENGFRKEIFYSPFISRLPVVTLALENDLFKDYSSEHLFARLDNYSLNFTTNLFCRLETLRQQVALKN